MSLYTEYFLNSGSDIVQLELLEISHPNFTKIYRIVRNAINGIDVTLEDLSTQHFDYYPLRVTANHNKADLDYGFKIDLGDLGEVLPKELDSISDAGGFGVKPVVKYRVYRSDHLSAPIYGPLVLRGESAVLER
jgi:hypothetical protein